MISTPGVAAKMFDILGSENINIHLISTSEIKVSCVIDKSKVDVAMKLLHTDYAFAER